jgi:3-oxoacyl-[acyl-carrier protein] reductase
VTSAVKNSALPPSETISSAAATASALECRALIRTGSLAPELAPHDITVNCVVPALINTDRDGGKIPPHYARRPIPMDRAGEPEEVESLVRYLCGPGARFISGQTMHVNGAWHVTI